MRDRTFAKQIAESHFHRTRPTEWFDELYRAADGDTAKIPWADQGANPGLLEWKERYGALPAGRAAVIGCGLGDDAEELARWGMQTVAFDVSPEAVEWCLRRFPESPVEYVVADLFALPSDWYRAFDFVLEIYIIQALPPEHRPRVMEAVASLTAPGGRLLTLGRARDEEQDPGEMPWPLTRGELMGFARHGLKLVEFDDYMDREEPPVRRFRTLWQRENE